MLWILGKLNIANISCSPFKLTEVKPSVGFVNWQAFSLVVLCFTEGS